MTAIAKKPDLAIHAASVARGLDIGLLESKEHGLAVLRGRRDRGVIHFLVPDAEIEHALDEAIAGFAAAKAVRAGQRLFSLKRADEIERRATDWLLRGFLVRDTLVGLIAAPGACKSFLAVDWACRVATGTPWFGRDVKAGPVVYLAGEGQRGLRKRMDGWERATGVSVAGAPLYVATSLPFLCDQANAERTLEIIAETVDASGPALIVVDTVARAMSGANENSTEDMGRFIASLDTLRRRWGATMLTVHHTGHSADDRGRGASAYGAALDSDFYLKKSTDSSVELHPGHKSKDWRAPPPVMLTKVEVEVDVIGDDGKPAKETTLTLHDNGGAIIAAGKARTDVEAALRAKARQLHAEGKSLKEIGDELGRNKSTIYRWLGS